MAKKAARKPAAPRKAKAPAAVKAPAASRAAPVAPVAVPLTSEPSPAQAAELKLAADRADKEQLKARGQTKSQQEIDAYNKGEFQSTDPVTGKARKRTGGNWQTEPEPLEDEDDE